MPGPRVLPDDHLAAIAWADDAVSNVELPEALGLPRAQVWAVRQLTKRTGHWSCPLIWITCPGCGGRSSVRTRQGSPLSSRRLPAHGVPSSSANSPSLPCASIAGDSSQVGYSLVPSGTITISSLVRRRPCPGPRLAAPRLSVGPRSQRSARDPLPRFAAHRGDLAAGSRCPHQIGQPDARIRHDQSHVRYLLASRARVARPGSRSDGPTAKGVMGCSRALWGSLWGRVDRAIVRTAGRCFLLAVLLPVVPGFAVARAHGSRTHRRRDHRRPHGFEDRGDHRAPSAPVSQSMRLGRRQQPAASIRPSCPVNRRRNASAQHFHAKTLTQNRPVPISKVGEGIVRPLQGCRQPA